MPRLHAGRRLVLVRDGEGRMISKLLSFSILASLLTLASAYGEEPEWKFSQSDADTIKFADIRNASRVIGDLWRHVGADADPLKEAVPALIFRFWELDKLTAEEHDRGARSIGLLRRIFCGCSARLATPAARLC